MNKKSTSVENVSIEKKYQALLETYQKLKLLYQGSSKPKVATNICTNLLPIPKTTEEYYLLEQIYFQIYIFYVLVAQNTHDKISERKTTELVKYLSERDFKNYFLDDFGFFFYKHKERNVECLKQVVELRKNNDLSFKTLLNIPGLGLKSSSLIMNEFISGYVFPVIDANVLKATQRLLPNFISEKTDPTKLFNLVSGLDVNKCKHYISYDLIGMFYLHRKECIKFCKENKVKCELDSLCELCIKARFI